MGNLKALVYHFFFTIFILTLSFSCKASDENREVYIVYMGALPEGSAYSPNSHHLNILQSVGQGSSASNSLIRSYKRSFNGFVAKLTDQERQKIAGLKEVVSVFPRKIYYTQTTRSWDFMGLPQTAKRNPTVESDTIIGVIDSGISFQSESFSDEGFGLPPAKWKGACKGGKNVLCNKKIIGARYYPMPNSGVTSAIDDEGHGSHTASTVAGNYVKDASFFDIAKGTARGGVPSARIAAYKVCNRQQCYSDSILAAFDDAIADGVDFITISIGSNSPQAFEGDTIAIGSFHAMTRGILTINSAGNDGPNLWSITSIAPWMVSVAASTTDRRIIDKVVLGNGTAIIGHGINSYELNGTTFPIILGTNASTNCSADLARRCNWGCLETDLVKGKILVCESSDQSVGAEAYRTGAIGLVQPDGQFPDISFVEPIPVSILAYPDFPSLQSYVNLTNDPHATILRSEEIKDAKAPVMASFSSRGPNLLLPDLLKPDITAPGVEILAAFSPLRPPTLGAGDTRRVKYSILSGTSMACPHVAGVAAYVKTFRPDFSPSAIKSALMTTAIRMNGTEIFNREFAFGSGHVNPPSALNPGLVYEAFEGDYINYLCSIGFDESKLKAVIGRNATCPKGSEIGSPRDLNYPSMAARVQRGLNAFTVEFHRRVKNVGLPNSTYKASISPESTEVDVKVVPEILAFKSLNEEKSFEVIVKGGRLANETMVSTSLVWSDGTHTVRSPIVVHNLETSRI